MKLIRVERNAFAASFTSSADGTSVRTTRVRCRVELDDAVGVARLERADDDPVGLHEVATALPSARNSGFET